MCKVANLIQKRREELGLTYEAIAEAVGVGKSTVRKWEKGMIKNISSEKLVDLARVLQVSVVELVPKAEDPEITEEDIQRLENLHQNPRLGLLFDRSRKMSSEDVEFMLQMADRILKERDRD